MAGLCTAAMVSSMVVPVWAADDAAEEETADDGDVADVSEALIGTLAGQRRRYLRILQR